MHGEEIHHDDLGLGKVLPDFLRHAQTVAILQSDVQQDDLRVRVPEQRRIVHRIPRDDLEVRQLLQQRRDAFADQAVVFDECYRDHKSRSAGQHQDSRA